MEIVNGPDDACMILQFCDSYALKRRQLVKEDVWIKQPAVMEKNTFKSIQNTFMNT